MKRGTLVLGASLQRYPVPGQGQSDRVYLFDDVALWSWAPWQSETPPLKAGQGRITELTLANGNTKTLYLAERPDAAVAVKASHNWLTWQESADPFGQKDVRLYAMPRVGGAPILVDEVAAHPDLIWLVHWCIDGPDVYWTLNRREQTPDGAGTGTLMHKRLPDGPTESLVTAPQGVLITTPSAYDGIVAWTFAPRGQPSQVAYRLRDGSVHEIGAIPSIAPAVGEGFIAFTRVGEADSGTIAALMLAGERELIDLGVGDDARAQAEWLSWGAHARDPLQPDQTMPYFVARPGERCVGRFTPPLERMQLAGIASVAGRRLAWVLSDNSQSPQRLSVVIQDFEQLRCD